jgi:SpoVK/Ycf46/Vps4 family AAA+-type ATPase
VTTNAPESIDTAFQRRMDVTVAFPAPGPEERAAIWRLHLPPGHDVAQPWLDEMGWRCALNGGQIRNAALHARLLALDGGRTIAAEDLGRAVEREYRKAGAVCPMRRVPVARAG